jgi:formylglycine-generating enzyme required for sulfatase activity
LRIQRDDKEKREYECELSERGDYALLRISGGKFLMGAPLTEDGISGNECPIHWVEVPDFYLGRSPVTNAQYALFLDDNPHIAAPLYWGDMRFDAPDQPVIGVSWHDASAFCAWAGLRLPSEAEWEYACRAETETPFWSGDRASDLARVGWYRGNSGGRLHRVSENAPNPFGLFDMHGNVWEWVADDWHWVYGGAPTDGSAWVNEHCSEARVGRGGSWKSEAEVCRCACRAGWRPNTRSSLLGFRPAKNAGHR